MADIKSNLLVTMVFDENSDIRKQVDTELALKNQIIKDLQHLITNNKIKHFVVADDEVINKKLTEEHKIGEWVIDDYEEMNHITRVYRAHCSLCKKDPLNFVYGTESWFTYKHKLPRLCPNCGADMKGNENILKE